MRSELFLESYYTTISVISLVGLSSAKYSTQNITNNRNKEFIYINTMANFQRE